MSKSGSVATALWGGFAALMLMIFSATPLYVSLFALFLEPVSKDLGWNLATFPQGLLTYSISFAVASPIAGRLSDRLGVRLALLPGIALTSLGLLGISVMSGATIQLIGASILIGCGGALVSPAVLASSVANHFERRRGLAVGIIFGSGPMLAAGAFSPVISTIITDYGWRTGYRTLAIAGGLVSFLMTVALLKPATPRDRPAGDRPANDRPASDGFASPGPVPAGAPQAMPGMEMGDALRSRAFWLILAISIIMPIIFGGVSGHIVAMASELGQSPGFGAAMLSATFLGGVVAPVLAGAAADKWGSSKALLPFLAMPAAGFALLLAHVAAPLLIVAAVFIGLGFSAWTGQTPLLVTRYFGLRSTGAIAGIVFATGGVALGIGPVVLGFLRRISGSYDNGLVACIFAQLAALALAALLGPFADFVAPARGRELLDSAPA